MRIVWRRLLLGTLIAEVIPVALLILLVALMAPTDPGEAQAFAVNLGQWVGPIAGALMAVVMTLWVTKPLASGHVLHGSLLGVFLAILDAAILIVANQPLVPLFVAANAGKIAAGTLGGIIAGRTRNA